MVKAWRRRVLVVMGGAVWSSRDAISWPSFTVSWVRARGQGSGKWLDQTDQGRYFSCRRRGAYPGGKPWYSHRISGKPRRKYGDCPGFGRWSSEEGVGEDVGDGDFGIVA